MKRKSFLKGVARFFSIVILIGIVFLIGGNIILLPEIGKGINHFVLALIFIVALLFAAGLAMSLAGKKNESKRRER